MSDHIHIFVGMRPTHSISDLMQDIKGNSSKWINEKKFLKVKFEWQEGYGAFFYSKSHVNNVIDYIKNQEEHHKKESFRDEYLKFLKAFEIDYDERLYFQRPNIISSLKGFLVLGKFYFSTQIKSLTGLYIRKHLIYL